MHIVFGALYIIVNLLIIFKKFHNGLDPKYIRKIMKLDPYVLKYEYIEQYISIYGCELSLRLAHIFTIKMKH